MTLHERIAHTSLALVLTLAALLGAACARGGAHAQPEASSTTRSHAIIAGDEALEHPAVVGVRMLQTNSRCSGVLLAPTVVLTAQHCVEYENQRLAPDQVRVLLGPSMNTPEGEVLVREIRFPRSRRFTVSQVVPPYFGADFVVLLLAAPITDIEPLKLRRAPLAELGERVTIVGFGNRDDGGSGERRVTEAGVLEVNGLWLTVERRACSGDSGGPALDTAGDVVAVLSITSGGQPCAVGSGGSNGYAAIARMPGLVDEALRDEGACDGAAVEVCDGYDNDCDEEIDEGCAQPGEACASDEECADLRACEGGRCHVPCAPDGIVDAYEVEERCPGELVCARSADNCFVGVCVPQGEGAEGTECADDDACASRHCAADADGVTRCRAPCVGMDGACKDGLVCAVDGDGCGSCVDDDPLQGVTDEGCASAPAAPPFLLVLLGVIAFARRRVGVIVSACVTAGLGGACGEEPPVFDALTPYERPALSRIAVDCPVNEELRAETVPFEGEVGQAVLQPFPIGAPRTLHGFGVHALSLAGTYGSDQSAADACGCVGTELVAIVGSLADGERFPSAPRVVETFPVQVEAGCSNRHALEVTLPEPIALDDGEVVFVGARYDVSDDGATMTCFELCRTELTPTPMLNVNLPDDGAPTLAYYGDAFLDAWVVLGEPARD